MPQDALWWQQHHAAQAVRWRRYDRRTSPRVNIRLDPIVRKSLLTLALGVVLILAGIALAPPT